MVYLKIEGLFLTRSNASGIILTEADGDRKIPIIIGEYEAQSIALALEKIQSPRPLAHDLLISAVEGMEGKIERVVITDFRGNTYFTLIDILHPVADGEELLRLDARPSDALAVAVRCNAPVFVENNVINHAAYDREYLERIIRES